MDGWTDGQMDIMETWIPPLLSFPVSFYFNSNLAVFRGFGVRSRWKVLSFIGISRQSIMRFSWFLEVPVDVVASSLCR